MAGEYLLTDEDISSEPKATDFLVGDQIGLTPQSAARSALSLTNFISPEDVARRNVYARKLGTVPELLPDVKAAELEVKRREDDDTLKNAPRLAEWLSQQRNADIGSDSVKPSASIEELAAKLENHPKPTGAAAITYNALARTYYGSIFMAKGLTAFAQDVAGFDDASVRTLKSAIDTQNKSAEFQQAAPFKDLLDDPTKIGTFLAEGVLENLTTLGVSMLSGTAGRAAFKAYAKNRIEDLTEKSLARYSLAGTVAGASAASIGMETGSIYADIYQKTGEQQAGVAATFGTAAGLLDAITPIRALRTAFGDTIAKEATSSILKRYGVEGLKTLAMEGATEFTQTWLENGAVSYVDGRPLLNKENLFESIEAALKGGGAGAALHVGAQGVQDVGTALETRAATVGAEEARQRALKAWSGLIVKHESNALAAQNAISGAETLQELSKQAVAHPLRMLDPEAFHDMAASITGDREIFVPAADMRAALAGITTAELNTKLPDVAKQLLDNVDQGGDIAISAADYLTHIVGGPIEEALAPAVKLSPDGLTYSQAQNYYAQQSQELDQQVEQIIKGNEPLLSEEDFKIKSAGMHPEAVSWATAPDEYKAQRVASMPPEEVLSLDSGIATNKDYGIVPGQTYADYKASHGNSAEVYANEIRAVRNVIQQGLQSTGRFSEPSSIIQTAPIVQFYTEMARRLGVSPTEAFTSNPLRFSSFIAGDALAQKEVVGQRALDYVTNNYEDAKSRYIANNTLQSGTLVIDADQARELFPEYAASKESRTEYAAAVQKASSKLAQELFKEQLSKQVREGARPVVVFSAGGSGSGKGAIGTIPSLLSAHNSAHIVYDSTLSKLDRAKELIDLALSKDKTVEIHYVMRDPVEAMVKGTLVRASTSGRVVPIEVHARTHADAPRVIKQLADYYKDNEGVKIHVVDNTRGLHMAVEGSIDNIQEINYNDLVVKLETSLNKEYENGNITKNIYDATGAREKNNISEELGSGAVERGRRESLQAVGNARPAERGNLDGNPESFLSGELSPLKGVLYQKTLASFDPTTLTMSFLKGANLSSVTHESGHFYLEMLERLASSGNASIIKDYETALNWFGVSREKWEQMGLEERRPYHEQWAESYERFVMEGSAPTIELQPIFSRLRAWMLEVYTSIKGFIETHPGAGKLNDEIRSVFDRLLASDEAIRVAEESRGYAPLFDSAAKAGVSDEDYRNYIQLGRDSTARAIDKLSAASMRDMRWATNAKNAYLRNLQKEVIALRKGVAAEVKAEVMAEPINLARHFLRTGEVTHPETGEQIKAETGFKLNTNVLREMYPPGSRDAINLADLRGMTNTEGLHPDAVAQVFGFSSGDILVRELAAAETATAKIERLTDQRMVERYGELIDPRSIEAAAEKAIHNEARAKFLATGLSLLTKSPLPVKQLLQSAKEAAANGIARKRVRDLRPKQHGIAEAQANRDAIKLVAKDPKSAISAQRAALLNNQLRRESENAIDEIGKGVKYLTKFTGTETRKHLDIDYLEQIDALLEPFDLRVGLTLKEIDRRKSLAAWVDAQEQAGIDPVLDVDKLETARRKSYKDMSVDEVRELIAAIKHIEHLGRLKKRLLLAKDSRDFAERMVEANASIEVNANRTVTERGTPTDVAGLTGKWAREFVASHRKFSSFMREFDGGKDGGVMFDLFLNGMNDAGNAEAAARSGATARLAELFKPILKPLSKASAVGGLYAKRSVVPGTKLSMTYEQRIMFVMNWGNEGNRQRLLDGGMTGKKALSEQEAKAVVDSLSKEEMDFVQGVWDYIASFRPEIAALERDLTGTEPAWVEPSPVVTKHGTYRGGYFPAKYDAELSSRSESLDALVDIRAGMKGAFGVSSTRNGYTKERAEAVVGRPLLLSFNAISQHVNEVTHRLAWQRWLIDANRSIKALDGTVREFYGNEVLKELKETVKDIAQGDAPATSPMERAINRLRTGSTVASMGWKISTALLQPSGLAQSWSRIGGTWMAKGVLQYMKNPLEAGRFVESKSKLIPERGRTMYREINELLNTVRVGGKISAVKGSFFYLIGKMQRTVDIPTWIGGYEKALAQLGYEGAANEEARAAIESKAIAMADQGVKDSQSGGQIQDLARIQRGSPALKLFTNFYSYFSATYNLNAEAYRRTNFKSPSEVGLFAADMILLNTVPVLFSMALKEMLKGECEWEIDCLSKRLGYEQMNFMFAQMILLREIGSAAEVATGGHGYGYSGPSGLRFFSDLYKTGVQAAQGEFDESFLKSANNTMGVLLHYPSGQINNTVDGIMAIEAGEVEGAAILPALIAGAK